MQIEEGDQKYSPSFRMDSPERISAAADQDENRTIKVKDEDDDLEFSFMPIPEPGSPIAAGDIFSNGKMLPVYPVFNRNLLRYTAGDSFSDFTITKSSRVPLRRLFVEEEREQASLSSSSSASSSSSSALDGLDGIPPETYCVWDPSQNQVNRDLRCKKSNSTGSAPPPSLRSKLKDLVACRSKSDGKEKFVSIPTIERATDNQETMGEDDSKRGRLGMNKAIPSELDGVTAQQRMTMRTRTRCGQNGQDGGKAAGRKSYRTNGALWGPSMRMGLARSRDWILGLVRCPTCLFALVLTFSRSL